MSKKYNKLDKKNKKTGLWKEKYTLDKSTSISKGQYINGKKHGIWKTYYKGKLDFQVEYKMGIHCGKFISYNAKGNVEYEALFVV